MEKRGWREVKEKRERERERERERKRKRERKRGIHVHVKRTKLLNLECVLFSEVTLYMYT